MEMMANSTDASVVHQTSLWVSAILSLVLRWLGKGKNWGLPPSPYQTDYVPKLRSQATQERDIVKVMSDLKKNCVVFFGSQSGTAEVLAKQLAKEGSSRFGLRTMVADLDDYDYQNLEDFGKDNIAIFVVSTYGNGEPSDNAVDFSTFITGEFPFDMAIAPLSGMNYAAFGLGNSTYPHYNAMVDEVCVALNKLGASLVSTIGKGDDGKGATEENFEEWKDQLWTDLAKVIELSELEPTFQPVYKVLEVADAIVDPAVEANRALHHQASQAPVLEIRELSGNASRSCLHVGLGLDGSGMSYAAGDHVAIWPTNSEKEIMRLLEALGISSDVAVKITSTDGSECCFPSVITYGGLLRSRLEICGPISRRFVKMLSAFAPDESSKLEILKLVSDKEYFRSQVSDRMLNVGQLLEEVSGVQKWSIPFSVLLEQVPRLQPRYFSASSSPLTHSSKVSITAGIEDRKLPERQERFLGVASGFLQQHMSRLDQPAVKKEHPNDFSERVKIPIHIRRSNFRLPNDILRPVLMVGAGTGIAPFRAFVQERLAQAPEGRPVGKMLLVFGCRTKADLLYADEWRDLKQVDWFELITAFSRESSRQYVQHKLVEHAATVADMLREGSVFVCGSASMGAAVNDALVSILEKQQCLSQPEAMKVIRRLRFTKHYQEDIY